MTKRERDRIKARAKRAREVLSAIVNELPRDETHARHAAAQAADKARLVVEHLEFSEQQARWAREQAESERL